MNKFKDRIVIDIGSGFIKAGFSGKEKPSDIFPCIIGRHKEGAEIQGFKNDIYIGQQAQDFIKFLNIDHPIKDGMVVDKENFEIILDYTLNQRLHVDPVDKIILLTEAAFNPKEDRQNMIIMMFENFNVSATSIALQALLSLYSLGKFNGIVMESGDGITNFVPVYEGFSLQTNFSRMFLGGSDLTKYFAEMFTNSYPSYISSALMDTVRPIKENVCFVALDFEEELKKKDSGLSSRAYYDMPDGSTLSFESERFKCPEVLFSPNIIGKQYEGIHTICNDTIKNLDIDIRKEIYSNIVLAGGNTMFPGIRERFLKEIKKINNDNISKKIEKIHAPEKGNLSAWIGGSLISSLDSFKEYIITKDEYDEFGPSIIHRKHLYLA